MFTFALIVMYQLACSHPQYTAADPLIGLVAAVSVGMKDGEAYLDLNYEEDSSCDTDLNVVMTQKG